jgi:hypothetical protein
MAASRIRMAFQRLAIGRSAAGTPRTYRLVRLRRRYARLTALLRKLLP